METPLLLTLATCAILSAPLGAWAAVRRRRSWIEGLLFGLFLGPLGVLIENSE